MQNESERTKVTFPQDLAEPHRLEDFDSQNEDDDLPSVMEQDSNKSSKNDNRKANKENGHDQDAAMNRTQPKPEISLQKADSMNGPFQSQPAPQISHPAPVKSQKNEYVSVDPITVMEISAMFKKFYYFGITVDKNRIKISNHKPIKKEDYLNLTNAEMDEEQYHRQGVKPKPTSESVGTCTGVKYTLYRARNGRVLIIRKPQGGEYEVMDKKTQSVFSRIKPEKANNLKRLRHEVDEMDNYSRGSVIPSLQNEISKRFKEFENFEESEVEEDCFNDDTKEDIDDYTEGFINRFRKRRGKKRGNSDLTVSVRV
jgi:hypothetical protein